MSNAAAKIREWRRDPLKFVREVFRAEPDAWQAQFLNAYATNDRLALKACKGPGKTCALAWCAWHFITVYPHPKIVGTSITEDNLRDGLWTELSKWQQRSEFLKRMFLWSKERVVCRDHPETWWMSARPWAKSADASKQSETLAGLHADHVLFIIDEAGGIPDAVVAAAEAGLANATKDGTKVAKMLLAGNPTNLSGPLYRACTTERRLWWVLEINSDPDDPNRTPRVSKEWAQIQIEKYGRDNPWVLVNVFGQFPPSQSNTLIGRADAMAAAKRFVEEREYGFAPRILGVDVARFGDDRTVITMRQGLVALAPRVLRNLDNMAVAGEVVSIANKWNVRHIFVDQTGVGAGVTDRLRELGYPVIGVDSSSRPTDARCLNMRAQMWMNMSEWIKKGCIPDDKELVDELASPMYKFNSTGKLQIESKDEMKKRGVSSPDKADSLALTLAIPVGMAERPVDAPVSVRMREDYDPLNGDL